MENRKKKGIRKKERKRGRTHCFGVWSWLNRYSKGCLFSITACQGYKRTPRLFLSFSLSPLLANVKKGICKYTGRILCARYLRWWIKKKRRKLIVRPSGQEAGQTSSLRFLTFCFWQKKREKKGVGGVRGRGQGEGFRVEWGSVRGGVNTLVHHINIGQKNLSNPTERFYRVKVHKSTGWVEAWQVGGGWAWRRGLTGGGQSVGGEVVLDMGDLFFFFNACLCALNPD